MFQLTRLMSTASNNVTQLARYATTEGQFPADAQAAIAEYRTLVDKVDDVMTKLAD